MTTINYRTFKRYINYQQVLFFFIRTTLCRTSIIMQRSTSFVVISLLLTAMLGVDSHYLDNEVSRDLDTELSQQLWDMTRSISRLPTNKYRRVFLVCVTRFDDGYYRYISKPDHGEVYEATTIKIGNYSLSATMMTDFFFFQWASPGYFNIVDFRTFRGFMATHDRKSGTLLNNFMDSSSQQFRMGVYDGYVTFINKATGLCMTVSDVHNRVFWLPCYQDINQQFRICSSQHKDDLQDCYPRSRFNSTI